MVRSETELRSVMVLNEKGALHIPLGLALTLLATCAMGLLGLMHHWRSVVALQLRMDRCVGLAALDLKSRLESLEASNHRIENYRKILALALVIPEAAQGARVLLDAEVARQEFLRSGWEWKRLLWLGGKDCGLSGGWIHPLPAMGWERPPPDVLGPQALRWTPGLRRSLRVQLSHQSRRSAAEVYYGSEGSNSENTGVSSAPRQIWAAAWAPPQWPGID